MEIEFQEPNMVGIIVGIICNILYLMICCTIKNKLDDNYYDNPTDTNEISKWKYFFVVAVLGCFTI